MWVSYELLKITSNRLKSVKKITWFVLNIIILFSNFFKKPFLIYKDGKFKL